MKTKILEYISDDILNGDVNINFDTPLYSSGLITSMGHLKLINFLERTFKVSIPLSSITLENFDTINQISTFVEQKQKQQ